MNRKALSWIFGAITIMAAIVAIGAGLYVFGTTALVALVTDNCFCCLGAIAAFLLLFLAFALTRNVLSRKI